MSECRREMLFANTLRYTKRGEGEIKKEMTGDKTNQTTKREKNTERKRERKES